MAELSIDTRFSVLCKITRAQHFAWREAVTELCPDVDPQAVVERMWAITGRDTGRSYSKRIDRSLPLARQVAEVIAWSSHCMGEDASVEPGASESEACVRHRACPWFDWHQKKGLLEEDRPGCDAWFASTIEHLNRELGASLRFETIQSLPEGGDSCLRRIWED